MTAKRALIVDDSRSARVILSRMLEAYGLEADAAESAEQALEYLRHARPDVIFMDHLMPGMDGFQAVQAIKADAQTATIPLMMYTSQEGDLYLSQARALGAVGVLPKTVKQAEVSRVLYQLHLLPERRDGREAAPSSTQAPPQAARVQIERPQIVMGEIEAAVRQAIAPALRELNAELRRFIVASFEAFARRIASESKGAPAPQPQMIAEPVIAPAPARIRWPVLVAVCTAALLPTLVLAVLYVRSADYNQFLAQKNSELDSLIEQQRVQMSSMQNSMRSASGASAGGGRAYAFARQAPERVPYGEPPLAGSRLDRLRNLVDELRLSGFRGKVRVTSFVGEFCLTGNGIEGYSIAPDDLPKKRCDLVGNPFEENLTGAQRQSVQFANVLSSLRRQLGDDLSIEVDYAGRRPAAPYPEGDQLTSTTAGEWNRIATQNNRVEYVVEPAPAFTDG